MDKDIEEFLERSCAYMNINALDRDWEERFVRVMQNLRNEELKQSFRRGFAKSVQGQVTASQYEHATGWDFDTEEEFREHLRHYWKMFYGDADPADSL